eukprot:859485_1
MAEQKKGPKCYYILIAGTTDSKGVQYADKSRDNGSYLNGVSKDLANMETYINGFGDKYVVQNVVRDMKYGKKSMVLDRIKRCAQECQQNNGEKVSIYYSGHGEFNTGNWCM